MDEKKILKRKNQMPTTNQTKRVFKKSNLLLRSCQKRETFYVISPLISVVGGMLDNVQQL